MTFSRLNSTINFKYRIKTHLISNWLQLRDYTLGLKLLDIKCYSSLGTKSFSRILSQLRMQDNRFFTKYMTYKWSST